MKDQLGIAVGRTLQESCPPLRISRFLAVLGSPGAPKIDKNCIKTPSKIDVFSDAPPDAIPEGFGSQNGDKNH